MKFIKQAIGFTLLLFTVFALSVHSQDEVRISKTWEVQRYDITVTLPQVETDRNMPVKALLSLKNTSGNAASTLTLRINMAAVVSDVKVNDSAAEFSKREEKLTSASSLQRIIISLPTIPANAIFTVAVDYKLNVKENSGVGALSSTGSQFLPLSFWYPTPNSWFFARGADYAPFNLTVSAGNLEVVAPGERIGSGPTFAFDQKYYGQPFFAAGNWDQVNSNGIAVYMPKGANADQKRRAEEIAQFTNEAKNFVEDLLGKLPPIPVKVVSVHRGAGFSGGGTIFVEDSLFNRQKMDAQSALNIAESIAKVWLGNVAMVDGDGYGVIREGLSRYIATMFIEKKFGKEVADVERLRQRVAYAAVAKRDSPLRISSPLDDYYYASVANKGATVWRLLARKAGSDDFFATTSRLAGERYLDLRKIRNAFPSQKALLDYFFDEILDMNLLVGLPKLEGGETKSALRNTGAIEVTVDVVATTSSGEKLRKEVTIPPSGFGEVAFKISEKIVRTEIDAEKLYPQTEYSDDIVPRESDESDTIVSIKRAFDKQDFTAAEKSARASLLLNPKFDDARVWLARSLLAQNKFTDAEREFRSVLDEKLPSSRSIAWANVGLGETALKLGNKTLAAKHFDESIKSDAEYGASLAARIGRRKAEGTSSIDESIKGFFGQFDRAVVSARKADVDALIVPGEIIRFSGGVTGAQAWQTKVLFVDTVDANTALVEVELTIRLLNREVESGTAVFQISRTGSSWKLSNVAMFEVR